MASTDIDFRDRDTAQPKRTGFQGKLDDTKAYLWNPQEKTFMGRTAMSWGKISLFYFVFYVILAGFFAAMLVVFFQTMDDKYPAQTGMNSLLKDNPGMGFRPMPKTDSTLIKFKQGVPESYKKYTDNIKTYMAKYARKEEPANNDLVDCPPYPNNEKPEDGKACRINMDELGTECTEENDYGYRDGTPCILLKLNKVYNWEPIHYDNSSDDFPTILGDEYKPDGVFVTCEGENFGDADNLRTVEFHPAQGFLNKYFPFKSQSGYLQPVVFARLRNLEGGVLTQIWCKSWSKNIKHHKNDRAGSVHIEVLMD